MRSGIVRVFGETLKCLLPSRYIGKAPLFLEISVSLVVLPAWLFFSMYVLAPQITWLEYKVVNEMLEIREPYCEKSDFKCLGDALGRWRFWVLFLQLCPFAVALVSACYSEFRRRA